MAKDCVRGGGVEIEIWHRLMEQIGLSFEVMRLAADGNGDVALFRTVDLCRFEALDKIDSLGDAHLQFIEARFRVGEFWHLGPRQSGGGALGEVGSELNLTQ